MLNKKTIDDIDVKGKVVLLRCDFNVPMKDGKITDDTRIVAALPTIAKLSGDGGRVMICSHLGKPKGTVKEELTLAPVAQRLSELLGQEVLFLKDDEVVGAHATWFKSNMVEGQVVLLENTRFRPEEEKNEDNFSQELASLCDVYVNDAFGTAHRAHCSTAGVAKFVKESAIGYLIEKEIKFLGNALDDPVRPLAAILGGSKVSSKISVIDRLLEKVDILIIGGGMAYTFIKAKGGKIGKSLVEEDYLEYAVNMEKKAAEKGVKLLLPVDTVIASELSNDVPYETVDIMNIPDDKMGVDIGEKSIQLFEEALKDVKTVIWNGPMGVFEVPHFAEGTKQIAKTLAEMDAITIIGGGDSAAAVNELGYGDKMTLISTGGGASLEFLEGKELPGITAIQDK
ncbi:MAG: phosphoglycerate kinase [Lachnospiraceae bacterium]|jgi:phosphoglycerate kinase|nr:phosphoglycerate kinase [Lachnospiraceae bacterium]